MNKLLTSIKSFARDEEGAGIIEYALIVAVVSLGLIALIATLLQEDGAMQTWIDKVVDCLEGNTAGTCF
jgi:pilus assembly protein Flp/PilA